MRDLAHFVHDVITENFDGKVHISKCNGYWFLIPNGYTIMVKGDNVVIRRAITSKMKEWKEWDGRFNSNDPDIMNKIKEFVIETEFKINELSQQHV